MPGLTDMEELIATVPDKEVADYLREAFACYGTGAHRACVVLTHIALFEGLRRKIREIAPVNKVAKKVSEEIEPLAEAQKVFETPLIQRLKGAEIITALESQILVQLNDQRNKAAHPSGHIVTAEEARFVFSEAIQKFLSKPVRETSYLVEEIVAKLATDNLFPASVIYIGEWRALVDAEIANLDPLAMPFLFAKLVELFNGEGGVTQNNARVFLQGLAEKRDEKIRLLLIKKLIEPNCSVSSHAHRFSEIFFCDPQILIGLSASAKLRCRTLLLENAKKHLDTPYTQLRNPARQLVKFIEDLGETTLLAHYREFAEWVVDQTPTSRLFVEGLKPASILSTRFVDAYISKLGQPTTAVALAQALPLLDEVISSVATSRQSFGTMIALVDVGRGGNSEAMALASAGFESLPRLKDMAIDYAESQPNDAEEALNKSKLQMNVEEFRRRYLPNATAPTVVVGEAIETEPAIEE